MRPRQPRVGDSCLTKPVRIIRDTASAEVMKDPIRRQILELLAEEEMTEAEISKKLEFSQASISHHMKALGKVRLVEIARTEAESHGIIQKFYRASARIIMVDYERMPYSIRRYTLALYIERIRGALAAIAPRNRTVRLSRDDVEALSDALARQVVAAARQVRSFDGLTREEMILRIYSTALARVSNTPEGRALRTILDASQARSR